MLKGVRGQRCGQHWRLSYHLGGSDSLRVVQMRHLSWHLRIGSLTVVLVLVLGLHLTLRILCRL